MADLRAEGAADRLEFPKRIGAAVLSVIPPRPMIAIAPYRGRSGALGEALAAHLAVDLPETGKSRELPEGRIFWTGAEQWFLRAPEIPEALRAALAEHAAVSEQSDAWTGFGLDGVGVREVLARLLPIDMEVHEEGAALRTMLGHMMCAVVVTTQGVELWVMRSFSLSAVHEIETAMRRVAGIAELSPNSDPSHSLNEGNR